MSSFGTLSIWSEWKIYNAWDQILLSIVYTHADEDGWFYSDLKSVMEHLTLHQMCNIMLVERILVLASFLNIYVRCIRS